MRQAGEMPSLSTANWEFLSSRAQINLSPDEIASFDQALRPIVLGNVKADLFNHNKLRDSGMPVKRFEAIHKGLGAKMANKNQAENLLVGLYYSLGSAPESPSHN